MSALISNSAIKSLLRGVLVWAPLWMLTTVVFGALGVIYAFGLKQDIFVASQAILVRDEATGAVMRLGRFQSQAELKAAQEIVLEMTKSHQVVKEALAAVGKPPSIANWIKTTLRLDRASGSGDGYPSNLDIEEAAKSVIQVHAPKGVEFGVTEFIYLDTKSTATEHALALNKALCDALESRLQKLRQVRADGVIEELVFARDSARKALSLCTEQLNQAERDAGSDLADLRGMTDAIGGGASSKMELETLKNEIRQTELSRQSLLADRDMLVRASEDPKSIIVAPAAYLNSHPGLRRMREGLVDVQIAGATLRGKYTDEHPAAIAAESAENAIIRRFSDELRASIVSLDTDIALTDRKLERLVELRSSSETRLLKLGEGRANYANLIAEVKSKTLLVESAERELAEVEAARDSSLATSLLTRIDPPIVSDKPIGPGKTTLSSMCAIAGLVFGMGIVFAITPIDFGPTYGRRTNDRAAGRRAADSEAPIEETIEEQRHASVLEEAESSKVATRRHAPVIVAKASPPAVPAPETLSSEDVDVAFRELARLTSRRPTTKEEAASIQSKIQDLKSVLESFGHKTDAESLQRYGWTKPRGPRNG